MPFDFNEASAEKRAERRQNQVWCVERLQSCKSLALHLATSQGIYTPLSQVEERLLQEFHRVQDAHTSVLGQYDGTFDQLCQYAGLLHSDVALLQGRIRTLYQEREPLMYEAEVTSLLYQMLLEKEDQSEEGTHHDQ